MRGVSIDDAKNLRIYVDFFEVGRDAKRQTMVAFRQNCERGGICSHREGWRVAAAISRAARTQRGLASRWRSDQPFIFCMAMSRIWSGLTGPSLMPSQSRRRRPRSCFTMQKILCMFSYDTKTSSSLNISDRVLILLYSFDLMTALEWRMAFRTIVRSPITLDVISLSRTPRALASRGRIELSQYATRKTRMACECCCSLLPPDEFAAM